MVSQHRFAVLLLALGLSSVTASQQCFERAGLDYEVAWAAEGGTFFDGWNFEEVDYTGGAVRYVSRDEALNEQLALVNGTHAIIRPGGIEERVGSTPPMKQRRSVKLTSNKTWTYFLTAMRFSHTPYGCGVWPAFWALGAGGDWPNRGELDMIEYWDNGKSLVSYHGGSVKNNTCKLDKQLLNKEGCPNFSDRNHRNYDCATDYSKGELGCAPNNDNFKALNGKGWSNNPGVIAAEWTKEYIKVFYIPEAELPQDLAPGATPKPDTWDEYVISYYPFARSGCDVDQESLASAKQLVLNIELCGGAGGSGFPRLPFTCNGVFDWKCRREAYAKPGDCCYNYMIDEERSDTPLAEQTFFNISWVKVWQQAGATAGLPNPPSPPGSAPWPRAVVV